MSNNSSQNSNSKNNNDRKEEILYRVVRIVIIFAVVWIVGTKMSSFSEEVTKSTSQTELTEEASQTELTEEASQAELTEEASQADLTDEINQTVETNQTIDSFNAVPDKYFRNENLLNKHFEKHGIEMGFANAADYEKAASDVTKNPKALHKYEKEDGDDVYFIEDTNEFVVVSTDGYIRTYYYASGKDYFDRQ